MLEGGCQLDDTKPILGDSDINIDAKSLRRKLDLSTDPGEWLYLSCYSRTPKVTQKLDFSFIFIIVASAGDKQEAFLYQLLFLSLIKYIPGVT